MNGTTVDVQCPWCRHEVTVTMNPESRVQAAGGQTQIRKVFGLCVHCGNQAKVTLHVGVQRFTRPVSKRGRPDQGHTPKEEG